MNEENLGGIGKTSRQQLANVIAHANGCFKATDVAECLQINVSRARKLLSNWSKGNWIKRIRPGLYLPADTAVESAENIVIDPWKVAAQLYSPCYIGGWSAAEYWGLTDQIFTSLIILTKNNVSNKKQVIGNLNINLKNISSKKYFGLKTIWKDSLKVYVSDPHKTIIDFMDDPTIAGGIRSSIDMLKKYFASEHFSPEVLLKYAEKMENKAIYKRLGFVISILFPNETFLIDECLRNLSTGIAQLDPSLKGTRIKKKWKLRIPEGFII